MSLSYLAATKELFLRHNIKPSRGLGQNFLVDEHVMQKLVIAAHIQPEDTVLEIGPGAGFLTQKLARIAQQIIAVEKDKKMVEILRSTLTEFENVDIVHADALKIDYTKYEILDTAYKLVANLPYYITAPTIRKFLEAEYQPQSMTFIIQKEVARRICAKPPDMSILAVSVQFYAAAKIIAFIKPSSFWPQPHVQSAIIHIVPRKQTPPVSPKEFFRAVKAGFSHPRKQLINNLSAGLNHSREQTASWLEKNSIEPARRAETLSAQDWINLVKNL
jgi:16S rRNA (adenine1518-N6/adenine1519-N6)-dimethyltransferase